MLKIITDRDTLDLKARLDDRVVAVAWRRWAEKPSVAYAVYDIRKGGYPVAAGVSRREAIRHLKRLAAS